MQNGVQAKFKKSKLDIKTSYYVFLTFSIQMVMCLFVSAFHVLYIFMNKDDFKNWIDFDRDKMVGLFAMKLCNWILILGLVKK